MKVLLVEDDDVLGKVLTRNLAAHHYVVDVVKDGEMGWTYGSTFEYDLLVLDVVLPKLDGISLCKRFRTEGYATPILMLTAQDARTVKIQGLDAGADDYVVKPFDAIELMARMRALLRRSSANPFPLLAQGGLVLNPRSCDVSYNGKPLALTPKEYELLEVLLRDSQYVFGSDELIDRLWSSEEFPSEATVRSHIRRLRQKLVAAGAPSDLIGTLHGRGYYLKAVESVPTHAAPLTPRESTAVGQSDPAPAASVSPLLIPDLQAADLQAANLQAADLQAADLQAANLQAADLQAEYVAFLNGIWTTSKPQSLAQVEVLLQAVNDLQHDRLTAQQQSAAHQIAHTLVGTLGIFGDTKTIHLARQLHAWLGDREVLQPNQAPLIRALVTDLQQALQHTTQIEPPLSLPETQSPQLLLVSDDTTFNQSLAAAAKRCGIHLHTVPTLDSPGEWAVFQPQVILLRLPTAMGDASLSQPSVRLLLDGMETIAQQTPAVPLVVVSDCDDLNTRLAVRQRCGSLFLSAQTPIEQVMSAIVTLFRGQVLPAKVMVVDDDRTWLSTLPTLLKPWGLQVTTLAEPQQFWTVLQSVMPDVLILDVNMPQVNGFELCQVLRSDPHWQQVPVLFLSVSHDTASQQQAFTVGADDYLCKPVMGVELAQRILSRLQRQGVYRG